FHLRNEAQTGLWKMCHAVLLHGIIHNVGSSYKELGVSLVKKKVSGGVAKYEWRPHEKSL
ncbi:MAG: hypothetical protein KDA66_18760, partial [Planctomycetaceae bacterium]|nr:hypothetical protein [Planctomycetaceae bacterium]